MPLVKKGGDIFLGSHLSHSQVTSSRGGVAISFYYRNEFVKLLASYDYGHEYVAQYK